MLYHLQNSCSSWRVDFFPPSYTQGVTQWAKQTLSAWLKRFADAGSDYDYKTFKGLPLNLCTTKTTFYYSCSEIQCRALCHDWPCGWAGCLQENWPPPPQCDPSNLPAGRARLWLDAWSGTGWSSHSTTESSSRFPPTAGDRNQRDGGGGLQEVRHEFETDHQQRSQTGHVDCCVTFVMKKHPLNAVTLKFHLAVQFLHQAKPVHDLIN